MSLSVNAASSISPASSATPDLSKEKLTLNKLLQQYTRDLQQGQTASQLQGLGRQIQAAAQLAGEHVRLPTLGSSATAPAASGGQSGALNKTA